MMCPPLKKQGGGCGRRHCTEHCERRRPMAGPERPAVVVAGSFFCRRLFRYSADDSLDYCADSGGLFFQTSKTKQCLPRAPSLTHGNGNHSSQHHRLRAYLPGNPDAGLAGTRSAHHFHGHGHRKLSRQASPHQFFGGAPGYSPASQLDSSQGQ